MKFTGKKLSISKKLTLIYSSILISLLIVFTLITYYYIRNVIIRDNEMQLTTNINNISNYMVGSKKIDKESLQNISVTGGVFFTVYDKNMNIVYSNLGDKSLNENKDKKNDARNNDFERGSGLIFKSKSIDINGIKYNIEVEKYYEDIGNIAGALWKLLIFISILGTFVSFVSGSYLSKKLLKPIKDITKTAKEITGDNLNKRIVTDGPEDELKELSITFNSMIERLETDFEKQKRFVSDASHELRTPLSIISGHTNMLNRWGKNDPVALNKSLKVLQLESENMNNLIENLLYLARVDNKALVINKTNFNIKSLIESLVEETKLNFPEFSIIYNCDPNILINADYNMIKQVMRILLDNSIKYSYEDKNIIISVESIKEGVIISVEDSGIGIKKESMPYIFDRFYRVDESRTKSTGGTGLGLSIAKEIIKSHRGEIFADSSITKGTKISFTILS